MSSYHEPGTLPTPGPIGRSLRFTLGLVALYFFAGVVRDFAEFTDGPNIENALTWAGLGYIFYALPGSVNLVLSRSVSAGRLRLGAAALFIVAGVVDFSLRGSFFGGAFGVLFGALLAYVLGLLGISFVVAAISAAPG